jgi:hypothetical protein
VNAITSTIDTGNGSQGVRLDLATVNQLHPAVVDEWLLHPRTNCGHQHQLLATMTTLRDMPDVQPVTGVWRQFSHVFTLGQLSGQNGSRWTAERLATSHVSSHGLVEQSIQVRDDEQARHVCHSLVKSVLVGGLSAWPDTPHDRGAWRYALAAAVWWALTDVPDEDRTELAKRSLRSGGMIRPIRDDPQA